MQLKTKMWVMGWKERDFLWFCLRRKKVWGLCEEVRAEGLCPLLSVVCGKGPPRLSSCNKASRTDLCLEQKSCNPKPEKGYDKSLDWNAGAYSLILGQSSVFWVSLGGDSTEQKAFSCPHSPSLSVVSHWIYTWREAAFLRGFSLLCGFSLLQSGENWQRPYRTRFLMPHPSYLSPQWHPFES